ncbi:oligosaccharide flippase family protein [Curtobacterium sp. DN_7.5]|uniref:oligosaccharide flippase family protein n=1 Tax=Curtobacterium sp. DN_7.5 TaxID=3049047 RepID=UPI001F585E40|nr:oligosaccharide flippase family protein [Curtobacterium sp. DN_7.5]
MSATGLLPTVSLAASAVRGTLTTGIGTWVRFVLQFGTVIVVARVLGPTEYGAAAVVLIASAAAELLRGSGVATVVARDHTMPEPARSTLHLLNTAAGVTLGSLAAVVLATVPIGPPSLRAAAPALGLVFVFAGLAAVPTAVLSSRLRFRFLAAVEMTSMTLGCATAVVLVAAGVGAPALVWQAVVFATASALPIVLAGGWRPVRPQRDPVARAAVRMAGNAITVQALNFCSRSVDRVLIGATAGPTAAGLWAQAMQLLTLPLEQLLGPAGRVAVPTLSRAAADDERLRRWYRAAVGLAALVLWPAFTVAAVLATPLIATVFGDEWAAAGDVFRLLALAGVTQTVGYVTVWVFVSTGRFRSQRRWALVTRPLVFASFFAGVPWGLEGMAIAYVCAEAVIVVPGFIIATRGGPLRLTDLLSAVATPAMVAVVAGCAAYGAVRTAGDSPVAALLLGTAAGLVAIVAGIGATPSLRRLVSGLASRLRSSAGAVA